MGGRLQDTKGTLKCQSRVSAGVGKVVVEKADKRVQRRVALSRSHDDSAFQDQGWLNRAETAEETEDNKHRPGSILSKIKSWERIHSPRQRYHRA